jgi:hypothetical protein
VTQVGTPARTTLTGTTLLTDWMLEGTTELVWEDTTFVPPPVLEKMLLR